MKKTSNRLHSLFAALAALILAAALAVPAFAVDGGFADIQKRLWSEPPKPLDSWNYLQL